MIAIIDYGVGNVKAFANIYKQLGLQVKLASTINDLKGINKIILPGVGSFDYAMKRLDASGLRTEIERLVLVEKMPVIGICVGMQMLAKSSEEGKLPGLGWINAHVRKFDVSKINFATHLPHMGWNDVLPTRESKLFQGLEVNSKFYFLHSYYFDIELPDEIIAQTKYGIEFACAINKENIYGIQCHPEKSHQYGIRLLKNFAEI